MAFTNACKFRLIHLRNVTKFDVESYATTLPTRTASNIVMARRVLLTRILVEGGGGGGGDDDDVGTGLE